MKHLFRQKFKEILIRNSGAFNSDGVLVIDKPYEGLSEKNIFELKQYKLNELMDLICDYANVSLEEVQSRSRNRNLCALRSYLVYYCHYRGRHTLKNIAICLGRNPDGISRALNKFSFLF